MAKRNERTPEQVAAEIQALQEEHDRLVKEREYQPYPKWVRDQSDPTGQSGWTVHSEEEERDHTRNTHRPEEPSMSASQKLKSEEIRDTYIEEENRKRPLGEPAKPKSTDE